MSGSYYPCALEIAVHLLDHLSYEPGWRVRAARYLVGHHHDPVQALEDQRHVEYVLGVPCRLRWLD